MKSTKYGLKTLLLVQIWSFTANAQVMESIKLGSPSRVDGFVIDREQERQMRGYVLTLENKNLTLNDLQLEQNNQIDLLENKVKLVQNQPTPSWKIWMYFGLGVVATSAALYGAHSLYNGLK